MENIPRQFSKSYIFFGESHTGKVLNVGISASWRFCNFHSALVGVYATKSLPELADSRNAIKTGKRELTFREILLLLSCKSSSRHRVNFPEEKIASRVCAQLFLVNNVLRALTTFHNYHSLLRLFPRLETEMNVDGACYGETFLNFQFDRVTWLCAACRATSSSERADPVQLHGNEKVAWKDSRATRAGGGRGGGGAGEFREAAIREGWLSNQRVRETELN